MANTESFRNSTIARSFSQELMDIFRIENSVADLDEKVDKRYVLARDHSSLLRSRRFNRSRRKILTRHGTY